MILIKYIIKNHFAPFLFSIVTLMFIFLFQFLMRFADRLVGKGLDTWIIIQLITYNLAWMVVLVVPMAVLVATLMAFGNMSQNNEVTIMKTAGVSLYRMMVGPLFAAVIVSLFLIYFNNNVLPDANHQAKILMQEISQTKPTLSLEPGVFSQEVNGYAILVREVDPHSNKILGVTIYDYSNPSKINIVTALRGNIYFSQDQTKLLMDLYEGEIHESDISDTKLYRKIFFEKHRIAMNAEQFSFQQNAPGSTYRGDRELSAADMSVIVDSLEVNKKIIATDFNRVVNKYFFGDSSIKSSNRKIATQESESFFYPNLIEKVRSTKNEIQNSQSRLDFIQKEINKYLVEIHKKYSIPAACIIFILLGAPLGVMVRKGGFGMAASISLAFFLIYWASLIGGEKLADRAIISPFGGMWIANLFMGVLGLILTYRVAKENINLKFDFVNKFIPKSWRQEKVDDVNS
ncbi:MAG: YjgP/YjgQ family permease [Chlorobiaceae bacterium]|nr:YjgP/YjgQ family permease [Chlorobiaceae bacterium]MBA4308858.1 YjgP/YjgQ family permease [Chlorobiaceae bacterium]